MRRSLLFLLLFLPLLAFAAKGDDALRAVARIVTFSAAGDTVARTHGFFIDRDGTLLAPYAPFRGAARAEITDARGRRGRVLRIVGADSGYDLLRATTDLPRRADECLPLAAAPAADTPLALVPFADGARGTLRPAAVLRTEALRGHAYYTLSLPNAADLVGLPLVADFRAPRAVAVAQFNYGRPASAADTLRLYALSAGAADSLRVRPAAVLDADFAALRIPALLPADERDAYTYVYMLLRTARDTALTDTALRDLLTAHPRHTDILPDAAENYAARRRYAAADSLLDRAYALAPSDSARARRLEERAGLVFRTAVRDSAAVPPSWSAESALRLLDRAERLAPRPSTHLLRGAVLYALRRDTAALRAFERVNRSRAADARSFFFAAQALARSGGAAGAVRALLDSAVARSPRPFTADAAAPLMWRSVYAERTGDDRRAALDLTDYERLAAPSALTAAFFLRRAVLSERARLYRRALDDYTTAAARAADRDTRLEALTAKALLSVRLSAADEAMAAATELHELAPDTPDALKLLGLAHNLNGRKTLARRYLSQAAAKGDKNAADLLRRLK